MVKGLTICPSSLDGYVERSLYVVKRRIYMQYLACRDILLSCPDFSPRSAKFTQSVGDGRRDQGHLTSSIRNFAECLEVNLKP